MTDAFSRRGFLRTTLGGVAASLVARRADGAEPDPAIPVADAAPPAEAVPEPGPPAAVPALERVPVRFVLNGAPAAVEVRPDEPALDTIRERLGLTGAKEACGHGACGACAVLVDGAPVATCLLPATSLEGRTVATIEALKEHPVQRAFAAEDALQCGFCTPGFVVEGAAFHDRWRAAHPGETPSRDAVADALAGHLCRCGAYPRIFAAVAAACAGKHDAGPIAGPRPDAPAKVTGRATYTVDVRLPGQLEGRFLRSPHAHARLVALDLGPAAALPGVKAVHAFLQPGAEVRYVGQEVAAVAAEDRHAATAALAAIRVEWAPLPSVVAFEDATKEGAPLVYPGRAGKAAPSHNEGFSLPLRWDGNVRGPLRADVFGGKGGKAAEAVDAARVAGTAVEGTWTSSNQCHTALEPHACVARWDGERLLVHLSTQAVHDMAADIAERWDLRPEDVELHAPHVGGGFGAKAGLGMEAVAAIELARVAGAPVRVVLDRHEEMLVGGYRPRLKVEVAVAADAEGGPGGIVATAWGDGGVSVGSAATPVYRFLYPRAPQDLAEWDVVTHAPPGKPFRGPGGPPAIWALEQAIDDLAIRRGEDPIALRRRWDDNPHRQALYARIADLPAWKGRAATPDEGRFRRGVGVAAAAWFYIHSPRTQVQLESTADGRLLVACAAQDMGNGTRAVLARAVEGAFGLPRGGVDVRVGDSRDVRGPMSAGSRTTASVGPAAVDAAERLQAEVAAFAGRKLGLREVVVERDGLRHAGGRLSWADALRAAGPRRVVGHRPADDERGPLPPMMDIQFGKGVPGAVQLAEVEVDTRLGRVRVVGTSIGVACGRILVPEVARAQVQGAVVQGIGFALYEERRLDPRTGRLLTAGLEDYRLPGLGDVPDVDVFFHEEGFEHVPGGGVGLGEVATLPCAAAIGNAVRHATGWRPTELPIRPDRVLAGVRA